MQRRDPKHCDPLAYDEFCAHLPQLDTPEGLLGAATSISLHFHPEVSISATLDAVRELANTAARRVRNPSPDALISQIHELLFEELGFEGNTRTYYALENSLIPSVLVSRRGIPITLCLVYSTVCRMVGLHVEGVNSPGHFLARVRMEHDTMLVDPFHKGRVLSAVGAVGLIERVMQQAWQHDEDWFPTCDPRSWLHRILNNLRSFLIHSGNYRDVAAMRELQSLLKDDGA